MKQSRFIEENYKPTKKTNKKFIKKETYPF